MSQHFDTRKLIDDLNTQLQGLLGSNLLGLYLYGSFVWGDFKPNVSDLDFLAVIDQALSAEDFAKLEVFHNHFAKLYPSWFDRIEVHYLTQATLAKPLLAQGEMAVISPGEPLNLKVVTKHYLMNWYFVREQSQVLYGPHPKLLIADISFEDFMANVRLHANNWPNWLEEEQPLKAQAYAVLTMSRALYSQSFKKQSSKDKAALWMMQTYPQWKNLIEAALEWRVMSEDALPDLNMQEQTKAFVAFALAQINQLD